MSPILQIHDALRLNLKGLIEIPDSFRILLESHVTASLSVIYPWVFFARLEKLFALLEIGKCLAIVLTLEMGYASVII